jgi:hypothetical protein
LRLYASPAMARRDLHLLLGLTALTLILVLVQAATGAEVLLASPALVLALPLLAGRYVGERGIARLASRLVVRARRAVRALSARLSRRAPRVLLPRGGRLLAASLAERGPPAPRAAR